MKRSFHSYHSSKEVSRYQVTKWGKKSRSSRERTFSFYTFSILKLKIEQREEAKYYSIYPLHQIRLTNCNSFKKNKGTGLRKGS